MTSLLRDLAEHEGAVEADLQRYYQVDYRDRYRRDEYGRRLLSLRRLHVLVKHLPVDSATARLIDPANSGWTMEAHLLDDLRMTFEAAHLPKNKKPKPHSSRPRPKSRWTPEREHKRRAALTRKRAHQRWVESQ